MKMKVVPFSLLVVILLTLVVPVAAFAQGEDIGETRRPAPAVPVQIGPDFRVQLDPGTAQAAAEAAALAATSGDAPIGAVPPEAGASGMQSLPVEGQDALDAGRGAFGPDSPAACSNLLANPGFEANTNWTLSPASNVKYSPYSTGGRAVYMTTANRTTTWLGQSVTIPQGTGSLHLSFDAYQLMDANDIGAFVTVSDGATFQRWWSEPIKLPGGVWRRPYQELSQSSFSGKRITLWFEMWPNTGDNNASQMWLDNVKLELCPGAATPAPTDQPVDLKISMQRLVSPADFWRYQEIFTYAADALYEATNGKFYLRNVTIYHGRGARHVSGTHIWWYNCVWPNADISAFNVGKPIYMGDYWEGNAFRAGPPVNCRPNENLLEKRQLAGYTVAHEMGHALFGLGDEYSKSASDYSVPFSFMGNHRSAIATEPAYDSRCPVCWLNFSTGKYFGGPNMQYGLFRKSSWDTLLQNPVLDNHNYSRLTNGQPRRTLYPSLATVAPRPGADPSVELPGQTNAARYRLTTIQWVPPGSAPGDAAEGFADTGVNAPYTARLETVAGPAEESDLTYPEPLVLVARLGLEYPIARSNIRTRVTAPNGSESYVSLRDDGVAPDYLAEDGKYTGIVPYTQNGAYKFDVTFNNEANRAAYTSVGQADVPWVVGDPIGESFNVTATTTVNTTGYTGDDHADGYTGASGLFSDNEPKRGQIDRPGDRDMFKSTLIGDGTFVLRLSSFALGMQPRIRLWQSDGATLIGEWTLVPEEGYYYFIRLTGLMGASFYTEISHMDGQAAEGMYALSFGVPLDGEAKASQNMLFLPAINR